MKRKNTVKKRTIGFFLLLLIAASLILILQPRAFAESNAYFISGGESTGPTMLKPAWIDQNSNGIADDLDNEVVERIANGTSQNHASVIVSLVSAPTDRDLEAFALAGGCVTAGPWKNAIYGFGGTMSYYRIADFVRQCPDILLVEKEAVCNPCLAYATQQVGARTYVWNTSGLQGDPNSSTAIIDSGIDASHPDFSPGFGDQNFSMKIVGWNDQLDNTTIPFDDYGHGTHCAGIAGGNGFFSVDASGNAIATYSGYFQFVFHMMMLPGMMVNKSGTITAKMKWRCEGIGASNITALMLYNGNKNLSRSYWTQVASVNTSNPDTWYTLSYNLSSTPSGGYDMYHLISNGTNRGGWVYFVLTISFPCVPPTDGFSAWTGMAPQTKLVGVRIYDPATNSGNTTTIINGIEWMITHKTIYHITVASMSFGFANDEPSVDSAVVNLVNSGVTTVVAAGNGGISTNYIYTPGSVDEVITVAAMNQFDNIASYSSQGGPSNSTGNTLKPDITAPGGSWYGVPILSADSNYNDAFGEWNDTQPNDATPNLGTSMATPIVAGAAQIVIQAMGGYANWQWNRTQALKPKMILLMTATETYPNLRETQDAASSPTLDRGGKDVHEGYGRLNVDAAVDSILKTYHIGDTVTDALGRPPTLTDISVLGQRLAWARNVQLVKGSTYTFMLGVPAGADYDLSLYNSTGTTYGEPAIVANSTTAATGGTETFDVVAPYNGTYYIVVKRATETTGSGNFTLDSFKSGGGCPYAYAWNGSAFVKDNNILPASETGNGTDTRNNYMLQQPLVPVFSGSRTSVYALQIREFESEQDYIDQVKLIAVEHSQGTSVAVTPEGDIVTYQNPASPLSCVDNYGNSRLTEISRMDGNASDPTTYFQGSNGNYLLLDFGTVTTTHANLILRDDYKCMDVCIDVQVPDGNGGWHTVEVLHPRDLWSIEAVNMTAYLPANGDFIIRLLWTAPHRLDYVGLDTSTQTQTTVNSAPPALAIHSTMGDVTAKLLYDDEDCVELVNGQKITLAFTLPNKAQGATRDFILYTDGYYYRITP